MGRPRERGRAEVLGRSVRLGRSRRLLRLGGLDGARRGAADGAAGKREQSAVAGALDGHAEPTLVTRADSGHATGQNLATLLHELGKNVGTLVVDQIHLFDTEL